MSNKGLDTYASGSFTIATTNTSSSRVRGSAPCDDFPNRVGDEGGMRAVADVAAANSSGSRGGTAHPTSCVSDDGCVRRG